MGNVEGAQRTAQFNWYTTSEQAARDITLTGKNAIVTGANCGIGKETARVLAKQGANVIIACRDVQKGEEAAADIRNAHPSAKVSVIELNLASLKSIRKFAETYDSVTKKSPLHILVNNAGVMACPYSETEDGFQIQFGTNHLGHFLLTNLLLPRLIDGAPSRVVVVSSTAHRIKGELNINDWSGKGTWYSGFVGKWQSYGQSKTANILFAIELNRRLKEKGVAVTANALHPGAIATNLKRHVSFTEATVMKLTGFLQKTIPQGAATSVYCATAPELEGIGGRWLSDCSLATPAAYASNPEEAKKLWDLSAKLVGLSSTI